MGQPLFYRVIKRYRIWADNDTLKICEARFYSEEEYGEWWTNQWDDRARGKEISHFDVTFEPEKDEKGYSLE
jgi:hypothetical protein